MLRFFLSITLTVGVTLGALAQTISLSNARQTPLGQTVTLKGVVTNGAELGLLRFIQDDSAGIGLFFQAAQLTAQPVLRGDSVLVTGVLKNFNNLLELEPVTSYQVINSGNALPAPVIIPAAQAASAFTEQYEGRLVRIEGVPRLTNASGQVPATLNGNTNYRLDNVITHIMRVSNTSTGPNGLVGRPAPTGPFNVTGIMGQFCSTPPNGCLTGYQLLPRLFEDIDVGQAPQVMTRLRQRSHTTTSIALTYETNVNATSRIEFGLTSLLGQVITLPTQATTHDFELTNLAPGQVYYVRVTATNAAGMAATPIQAFATISESRGIIRAYFTSRVDTSFKTIERAVHLNRLVDDTLIKYIGLATQTLDISIYNFNNSGLSNISTALNQAAARGVRIRLVHNGSTANAGVAELVPSIATLASPTGTNPTGGFYGLMHNKFVVIDADHTDPDRPWVWTGSTNWTSAQINTDYNNVVLIQDQSLARSYKLEFEEMWGSTGAQPGQIFNGTTGTARFGPNKTDNTAHHFTIRVRSQGRDIPVESYFSPSDQVNDQIIRTIDSAQVSLQSANLLITRTDIAQAISRRIQAMGPACSFVIVNDTTTQGAGLPFRILRQSMGANAIIHNLPGSFHHKYLLRDHVGGRPAVLTGSHNWSNAGEQRNDENTVIIHDASVTNQFYQEYAATLISLRGTPCTTTTTSTVPSLAQRSVLAPNPARDMYQMTFEGRPRTLHVYDIRGALIETRRVESGTWNAAPAQPGCYMLRLDGEAGAHRLMVVR